MQIVFVILLFKLGEAVVGLLGLVILLRLGLLQRVLAGPIVEVRVRIKGKSLSSGGNDVVFHLLCTDFLLPLFHFFVSFTMEIFNSLDLQFVYWRHFGREGLRGDFSNWRWLLLDDRESFGLNSWEWLLLNNRGSINCCRRLLLDSRGNFRL